MIVEFRVYVVRCSGGCHKATDFRLAPDEAVADVQELGWLVAGDEHLCPKCKQLLTSGKPLSEKQRLRLIG